MHIALHPHYSCIVSDMKVLFVVPYLGASYGGTSKVAAELANSLGKLNLDIDVVSTDANDGKKLDVQLQVWLNQDTYRVKYFSAWHRSDLVISFSLIRWLSQHVKEYDVVHTHTLFSPLISLIHTLCCLNQVPYVITPHGMLDPWALSYKAWKKQFYYSRFEQPLLNHNGTAPQKAQRSVPALEVPPVPSSGMRPEAR